jgi:hypothetical protein
VFAAGISIISGRSASADDIAHRLKVIQAGGGFNRSEQYPIDHSNGPDSGSEGGGAGGEYDGGKTFTTHEVRIVNSSYTGGGTELIKQCVDGAVLHEVKEAALEGPNGRRMNPRAATEFDIVEIPVETDRLYTFLKTGVRRWVARLATGLASGAQGRPDTIKLMIYLRSLGITLVILVGACSSPTVEPNDDAGAPDLGPTGRCAGQHGPDCLLELPLVDDTTTLGLAIDGAPNTVMEGSVSVVEVPFKFTGVPWQGMTWTHRGSLFLPLPAPAGGWKSVALYSEQLDPGTDTEPLSIKEFAGRQVAAATGVPVAVIGSLPPNPVTVPTDPPSTAALLADHPELASCFGTPLIESDFQSCADKLVTASRDVDWLLAPVLARGYLRTLVALRNLGTLLQTDPAGVGLAPFQPVSFATGGYSKRGIAQWLVGAADPSVKAIWVGAGELPDVKTYTQLKYSEWGDQSSLISPESFYDTPAGQDYLAQYDPLSWPERLASVKISAIRGTNDEIWPYGLMALYPAQFPTLDHIGFIADATHVFTSTGGYTLATTELLSSWGGFVGRLAGQAPAPTVTAAIDLTAAPVTITATVAGAGSSPSVRLWYVDSLHCTKPMDSQYAHFIVWGKDDADMRDVAWKSVNLTGSGGTFTGTLPVALATLPLHGQIYVDVLDGNRFASTIPIPVTGGTDKSCP